MACLPASENVQYLFAESIDWASGRFSDLVAQAATGLDEAAADFFAQMVDVHFYGIAFHFLIPAVEFVFDLGAAVDVFGLAEQ